MSSTKRWLRRTIVVVATALLGWFILAPKSVRERETVQPMDEQTRVDGQRQLSRNPVRSYFIPRNWSQPRFPN